ncbi:amidase [Methylobrevis albus]|uniref:Amidase n=1 Tax=Methylobrevis albus TaxID=2793297 RepID=A0A931I6P0_9HYPH|nr:amidase [Methylobrevis albus]MBH0239788.1 amidase [Methylobrevis albus]
MLSLLDLLARLDAGRTSIEAVYDGVASTLDEREPDIRAFAHLDLGGARTAATGAGGPLRGLPIGVKDVFDTADMPSGYGSPIYDGWQPRADASVVTMARRAGAAVLGKTRTTEFAYLNPTVTRNPAAPGHTPGGSSSGSAAAVAAGMVTAAFGTQTAGSVIRPASFCGIAAIKPSYRLLPTVGVKPFSWLLDTVGVFAASVADCAMFLSAISGRELRVDVTDFGAPRIGVVRSGFSAEPSAAMAGAVDRLVRRAAAKGAEIRTVDLSGTVAAADRIHPLIMEYEGALALAHERDHHGAALSAVLAEALARGAATETAAYDAARSVAHTARRRVGELFENVDVLLMPAAPGAPPEGLGSTGVATFNRLWTLIGTPAVAVPGLVDEAGLPLGVQVVAPFGQDRVALAAANWLERLARG